MALSAASPAHLLLALPLPWLLAGVRLAAARLPLKQAAAKVQVASEVRAQRRIALVVGAPASLTGGAMQTAAHCITQVDVQPCQAGWPRQASRQGPGRSTAWLDAAVATSPPVFPSIQPNCAPHLLQAVQLLKRAAHVREPLLGAQPLSAGVVWQRKLAARQLPEPLLLEPQQRLLVRGQVLVVLCMQAEGTRRNNQGSRQA